MRTRFFTTTLAIAAAAVLTTAIPAIAAEESKIITPVTEETALEIALKHTGYTKDEAEEVEIGKGHAKDKEVFEVNFYVGVSRFEYDIEIATGEIINYEVDD